MKFLSKNIVMSSLIISVFTIFIKILGLIKQTTIASICGATIETDAFYISTGIIGQLAIAFFSAISISLLTMYVEKKINYGKEKSNEIINASLHVFIPLATIISLIFFSFSKNIAIMIAPNYPDENIGILSNYIKIMSVSFIPWCYYLIINVILEADKEFIPGRCQGLFQNLFLILATVFLYKSFGVKILVYSFLFSGIIECVLVTWCARDRFTFSLKSTNCRNEIKKLIIISIPLIIGNAVYEINDIVDKKISTNLGEGYASLLTYGSTINEIVSGIVVSAVSVVLFSNFTNWIAKKEIHKVEIGLKNTINILNMLIVPIMSMCIVCSDEITWLFYGRGNLDGNSLKNIRFVLIGYAVGFIFQAIRANLIKVYYAFKNTKTPMINGIVCVMINILLSFTLSKFIGTMGISLATSISMLLATIILLSKIKRYLPDFNVKDNIIELTKMLAIGVISSILVYIFKYYIEINQFASLIIEGAICLITYIFMLYIFKIKVFCESIRTIYKKRIRD